MQFIVNFRCWCLLRFFQLCIFDALENAFFCDWNPDTYLRKIPNSTMQYNTIFNSYNREWAHSLEFKEQWQLNGIAYPRVLVSYYSLHTGIHAHTHTLCIWLQFTVNQAIERPSGHLRLKFHVNEHTWNAIISVTVKPGLLTKVIDSKIHSDLEHWAVSPRTSNWTPNSLDA